MKSLYRTQKFNLDVVIYILTEGQKDIDEVGEASFFYPFMDTTTKCEFGLIYNMIDDWMNDLQTSEDLRDKILKQIAAVIGMAKALQKADVITTFKGNESITSLVLDGVTLESWDIIRVDKTGRRFVLIDIGYDKEDMLYHYMTIDDLSYETVIKKADRR